MYVSVRPIEKAVFKEFCSTEMIALTVFGDNALPVLMLPFSETSVTNFCKAIGDSSFSSRLPCLLPICADNPTYLS